MYPGNSPVRDRRRFRGSATTCVELVEDASLAAIISSCERVAVFVDSTLAAEGGVWHSSIAVGRVCSIVSSATID